MTPTRRLLQTRAPTRLRACLGLLALVACAPASTDDSDAPASVDVDPDGDTIVTAHEGDADPDGDLRPAYDDPDSDDDGLPDRFEAGDADPVTFPIDSDGDTTPDFLDLDSDGNGLPDAREGRGDVDRDGTPNHADVDDDGDGVPDIDELLDGTAPFDTDRDGTPDHRDTDSDDDGIDDAYEARCPFVDGLCDTDDDGTPDLHDVDSDGDGFDDATEGVPGGTSPRDTDQDGTPDFRDLDSDGDSLSDADERDRYGTDPWSRDTDGDGLADAVELELDLDPTDPASTWDGWMIELGERTEREESLAFDLGVQRLDVVVLYDYHAVGSHDFLLGTLPELVDGLETRVEDPAYAVYQIGGYCNGNYTGVYRHELEDDARLTCRALFEDVPLSKPEAFLALAPPRISAIDYIGRRTPTTAPYESMLQVLEGPGRDDDCSGGYDPAWDTLPWTAREGGPFKGEAGDRRSSSKAAGVRSGIGFRPFSRPVLLWFQGVQYTDPGVVHPDPDHWAHDVRRWPTSLHDLPYYPWPVYSSFPPDCPSDADYLRAAQAVRKHDAFVLGVLGTHDGVPEARRPTYSMTRFLSELDQRIDLDGDGSEELPFLELDNIAADTAGEVPEFTAALQAALTRIENTIAFDRVRLVPHGDEHGLIASIDPPAHSGLKRGDRIAFTITFRGTVPALDHDQVFRMGLNVLTDDDDLVAFQDIIVIVPGRVGG